MLKTFFTRDFKNFIKSVKKCLYPPEILTEFVSYIVRSLAKNSGTTVNRQKNAGEKIEGVTFLAPPSPNRVK